MISGKKHKRPQEINPVLVKCFTDAVYLGEVGVVVDMLDAGMLVDIIDEYGRKALTTGVMWN